MNNSLSSLSAVTTKYIALCEGDDYWTDPYKLQKQVAFLEANEDYGLCFHAVQEKRGNKFAPSPLNFAGDQSFSILDLADRNFIHTASVVYRNYTTRFPDSFLDLPVVDYPLFMLIAREGKIRYLAEEMAVYRIHDGGIWSTQSRAKVLTNWERTVSNLCSYPFTEAVLERLRQQLRTTRTGLLQLYQQADPQAFLKHLEAFGREDQELAFDWLLREYPAQLEALRSTRSYRLARTVSMVAAPLLKLLPRK